MILSEEMSIILGVLRVLSERLLLVYSNSLHKTNQDHFIKFLKKSFEELQVFIIAPTFNEKLFSIQRLLARLAKNLNFWAKLKNQTSR